MPKLNFTKGELIILRDVLVNDFPTPKRIENENYANAYSHILMDMIKRINPHIESEVE